MAVPTPGISSNPSNLLPSPRTRRLFGCAPGFGWGRIFVYNPQPKVTKMDLIKAAIIITILLATLKTTGLLNI